MKKLFSDAFSTKNIVAIAIGSALYFVIGKYVYIPTPVPNTNISLQYGLLSALSVIFGPIPGFLIGFIGHFLIDLLSGWGIWWNWILGSAIFGFIVGITRFFVDIKSKLTYFSLVIFNIIQTLGAVLCFGFIAPLIDIMFFTEPDNKVFVQGCVAAASNVIVVFIVGSALLIAYSKQHSHSDGFKLED